HGLASPSRRAGELSPPAFVRLLGFPTDLLAIPLPRQRLLRTALVARLQVEAVLLDVLDDVFLLDLALEAAEGVLDGLAFLDLDLGQNYNTPKLSPIST